MLRSWYKVLRSNFQEADHALDQMLTAMNDIQSSSDKISRIIKVIEEIAFQTNILALNAAVEAGMGFAVVADEVRNLAHRSSQAAKDTTTLIEDSVSKATAGQTRVDQVAKAVREISEASSQIKGLVHRSVQGAVSSATVWN